MKMFKMLLVAAVSGSVVVNATPAFSAEDTSPQPSQHNTVRTDSNSNEDQWYYRPTDDGRDLEIKVPEKYVFKKQDKNHIDIINVKEHNIAEQLPTTATNKQGNKISFAYKLQPNNTIRISAADENGYVNYGWWDSWGKCAAGTVGGTGTGAIAGAGSMAGIGALGGPWGVGAGAIGGGIAGGVSGGLTGAAASC